MEAVTLLGMTMADDASAETGATRSWLAVMSEGQDTSVVVLE